jgi:hypothetical protein
LDQIKKAARALGFGLERFRLLPADEAATVYHSALCHFVRSGNPRWWWEYFPASTGVHFASGDGWRHLVSLVPDSNERVWFIAEDFVSPEYSVWEGDTCDIQAVIGECSDFEYYIVQNQFRWLLCQNHHDVVVAVGQDVEDKLRQYEVA